MSEVSLYTKRRVSSGEPYFSFILWHRSVLHKCFNVTDKTHLWSNFHCQKMKEKWMPPDEVDEFSQNGVAGARASDAQ